MPLSTPETAESVATPTPTTTMPTWVAVPIGIPKTVLRPTLTMTTPMPSEVATPKIVPSRAAKSTVSPRAPWTRLPKIGASAERIASGMFIR